MIRLATILSLLLVVASGCDYQPKGTIVFELKDDREFDGAQLQYPPSAENRRPLKLRYVDRNVFMTTAALAPGRYTVSAHTGQGRHVGREVQIEAGKVRYEIDTKTPVDPVMLGKGPSVTARVAGIMDGQELVVLFIGEDLTIRRVNAQDGAIKTDAPGTGTYRVEVHALGAPPRSWQQNAVEITGPVNLGTVEVK